MLCRLLGQRASLVVTDTSYLGTGFGVLLVRKDYASIDTTYEYRADRLPEPGEEIEITDARGQYVRARVNGVEEAKSLPIRASEL